MRGLRSGFWIVLAAGLLAACQPGANSRRTDPLYAAGTACSAADIAHGVIPCPGNDPDSGNCIVQTCDYLTGIASACFILPDCAVPPPLATAGDGSVACGTPGARAGCTGPAPDFRGGFMACLTDGSWGGCNFTTTPVLDAGTPDSGVAACAGEGTACTIGAGACSRTGSIICVDGVATCNVAGATPGSVGEVCNGLDDDCDGLVDEATSRSCYTGPAGTDGQGICLRGLEACTAVAGSGVETWSGTCTGQVLPAVEVLDNLVDEDCNGGALMSAPCGGDPLAGELCSVGLPGSACYDEGLWSCVGSELRCSAIAAAPTPETCNNLDDDCDGTTDGNIRSCYDGPAGTAEVGLCQLGYQICLAGVWPATCDDDVVPVLEVCDPAGAPRTPDEDCNGIAEICVECGGDPRLGGDCSEGIGACLRTGLFVCLGGTTAECTAIAGSPVSELCNTLDDDCNGLTDDNVRRSCASFDLSLAGVGICRSGTQTCTDGVFAACTGEVPPATEIPNNGIDEDCTGGDLITTTCGGDVLIGTACVTGMGLCAHAGTWTCVTVVPAGYERQCVESAPSTYTPVPELCDGLDNDCDGFVDEAVTGGALTRSCWSGSTGLPDTGICVSGTQTCVAGSFGATCAGEVLPQTEICGNALDDDCDGAVDDGCAAPIVDAGVTPDAGRDAGTDAGLDAGVDAGTDAGMDAGLDAGVDSGSDSGPIDSGTTDGGASATSAGSACGNVGTHTLGLSIDNVRLDALFGTCAAGRRIGVWDQCGQFLYSAAGASSLTITGAITNGYYMTVVQCGGSIYGWPTASVGQSAGLNGFSSITFDGTQLADGDALICHDTYSDPGGSSTTFNRLAVPTTSILWGMCP